MTKEEFVKKYYPFIKRQTTGTGIFPEVVLSQAFLESSKNGRPGESKLSAEAKNLFGMKAGKTWKGKRYNIKTAEYKPGSTQPYFEKDDFRAYSSFEDSIKDYLHTLSLHPVLKQTKTIEGQFSTIASWYATDPSYVDKLKSQLKYIVPVIQKIKPYAAGFAGLLLLSGTVLLFREIFKEVKINN